VQRDNVAVEVATEPASSVDEFISSIRSVLSETKKVLPKDSEIVALPSARFEQDQLEHPEAKEFGCDPDYDAWDLVANEKPFVEDQTFRSFGAHIHVGTSGKDENTFLLNITGKVNMVKAMDCIHGMVSTVLDNSEASIDRRKLYGKPGAHRPTDYGVEYRVLSNYWLKSPITVMMMYHLTKDALDVVRNEKLDDLIQNLGGADNIKDVILTGNKAEAEILVEKYILPLLSEDSIFYIREAGKCLKGISDIYSEWDL